MPSSQQAFLLAPFGRKVEFDAKLSRSFSAALFAVHQGMDVARASPSEEAETLNKENKMKPTQTKPSVVFCHGLWADGSCFSKVIPHFRQKVTR